MRSSYGWPRAHLIRDIRNPLGPTPGLFLLASVLRAPNMLRKPWTAQARVIEPPHPQGFLHSRGKILIGHLRFRGSPRSGHAPSLLREPIPGVFTRDRYLEDLRALGDQLAPAAARLRPSQSKTNRLIEGPNRELSGRGGAEMPAIPPPGARSSPRA